MPNSLKCKIKRLCHNGTLTERERDRILKALEQEPCEDAVSLNGVIDTIEWYRTNPQHFTEDNLIEDIKGLPPVTPKQNDSINAVLDEIKREFKIKADGDDWYHTTDGLVWEEAIEILDKYRGEQK